MRRFVPAALCWSLLIGPADAGTDSVPLPVRKVVLFKNGIGYFQHEGSVPGAQSVEILLSGSQLDDVLKSLTVLDLGGVPVGAVTYDSTASLDRRLRELPIDPRAAESLVQFLHQVKGAEIEMETPRGLLGGRLLSAETRLTRVEGGSAAQVVELGVMTEDGGIRVVRLDAVDGFRFRDAVLTGDLLRSLDIVGGAVRGDVRRLRVALGVGGERRIFLAYTAEAPIWKSTYRAVLTGEGILFQGWAVVDNVTPTDWRDVELSLVSGAPSSFIYRLSRPLFAERPEVAVLQGIQTAPEVHESALRQMETSVVARGVAGGVPGGVVGGVPGGVPGGVRGRDEAVSDLSFAEAARRSMEDAAESEARAEQFEYRIRDRVELGRNESALIPILQADVKGEKVTVYNEVRGAGRARLAIWLTNNTGLTLDGGSFTVIDSEVYAGEGLFETIQPGERRLLSYAVDLAVEVGTRQGSERRGVERVTASQGVLRMVRKQVENRVYTIRNRAGNERVLLVEHPIRPGWNLVGGAEPVESTAGFHRFRVPVAGERTREFTVSEERLEETTYRLTEISADQILLWIRDRQLTAEAERALAPVAAAMRRVSSLDRDLADLAAEEGRIFQDQERLRGNLAGLSQTPEESRLRQRYIDRLEEQENRLESIRSDRTRVESERQLARRELERLIGDLSFG
jgi:hypothetical protein